MEWINDEGRSWGYKEDKLSREAAVPRLMPWVCGGTTQRLLGLEHSKMLGRLFILNL